MSLTINPGRKITYPGYGLNYHPVINYLNQNLSILLAGVTVGPPTSMSGGTPGIINILTNGTPPNNIYQNLNVSSAGTVSNYNTLAAAFTSTNSNAIVNANYLDRVFIAYNNSTTVSYSNVFPNLEVVYGYLGIAAGQFTNGDGAGSLNPAPFHTPSSVSTNPIGINDFPNLREIVGDLVIVTDYMTSIPTFESLRRCNSITIYLNSVPFGQPMQITPNHFPVLEHVQRFIRIFNLSQCTMIKPT